MCHVVGSDVCRIKINGRKFCASIADFSPFTILLTEIFLRECQDKKTLSLSRCRGANSAQDFVFRMISMARNGSSA